MKKNLFSDNKKGSKGFYAALGISAVMIGSACYFAYGQSEKLTEELTSKNSVSAPDVTVGKRAENVPKETTVYRTTAPVITTIRTYTTAAVRSEVTLPASSISIDSKTEPVKEASTPAEPGTAQTGAVKMENPKAPLADMSNVIGAFSGGELVKNETTGSWQTHNGTDLAAEVGAEVYAVSGGEIASVENDPIWGVTVVLDHHNGFITRYCGLSTGLEVQKGDFLVSGDLIGTVGNTADIESALPPHLHIELMHNGSYIDPLSELDRS